MTREIVPHRVLVLGHKAGSRNIGEAIYDRFVRDGWEVTGSDCWDKLSGDYRLDPTLDWEGYPNLVVTLGMEGLTPFDTCTYQEAVDVINANLVLPLLALHTWVAERQGLGGTCVVIGSYAHNHALTGSAPYCAAKAGLHHAVQELGWELTGKGYQFHIVHPYHVPSTPMGARVLDALQRERGMSLREAVAYQTKDLRLDAHLHPTDIAEVVQWLVEEPVARWLSGQGIQLYGGVR